MTQLVASSIITAALARALQRAVIDRRGESRQYRYHRIVFAPRATLG